MKKYSDYLEDKRKEEEESKIPYAFTDCPECNECREVIELMSKWMSIGSFQQKTPQKMVNEFKATMKRANVIIRQNKEDRGEYL